MAAVKWTGPAPFSDTSGASHATMKMPGLSVHSEKLWCVYVDANINELRSSVLSSGAWAKPRPLAGVTDVPYNTPALADLNGTLHLIFPTEDINLGYVHYQYEPVSDKWGTRTTTGAKAKSVPALITWKNSIICVFTPNIAKQLYYKIWENGAWSAESIIESDAGIERTGGQPALCAVNGEVHLFFVADDSSHDVLEILYTPSSKTISSSNTWTKLCGSFRGISRHGVSAVGSGNHAFIAFQMDPGDGSFFVVTDERTDYSWLGNVSTGEQSQDTPAVSIFKDLFICVWPQRSTGALYWTSRPLKPDFYLADWMSCVPDNQLLSFLSIPGTHHSCANESIRIVAPGYTCQIKGIGEQLDSGIRYIHVYGELTSEGQLMAFFKTSVAQVLDEIFQWLNIHPKEAVIVQIKQVAGFDDDATFGKNLLSLIADMGINNWALGSTTPKLLDIRGKIQLIRQFALPKELPDGITSTGINVYDGWQANKTFTLTSSTGVVFHVQDEYLLEEFEIKLNPLLAILHKVKKAETFLTKTVQDQSTSCWYINFASGAENALELLNIPVLYPKGKTEVYRGTSFWQKRVNGNLLEIVKGYDQKKPRLGVIVMDFAELPDNGLVEAIVRANSGLFI